MSPKYQDLAKEFRLILFEHMQSPSEESLEKVYEWSRKAIGRGMSLLDAIRIHRQLRMEIIRSLGKAQASIASGEAPNSDPDSLLLPLENAENLFTESLGPFEMTHRSFYETNTKLRLANTELEEAIRVRDEFLTIASHELKTPMTPLKLRLQILKRHATSQENIRDDMIKNLTMCERSLDRLSHLTDELLSVSRIRAGVLSLQLEEVDLSQLIFDVVDQYREEFERVNSPLKLNIDSAITGRFDPMKMEEAISNFLSNAVKFDGGHPVEISLSVSGGTTAKLIVRDHGIGIDPKDHTRIFQRFERAVSPKHFGGLGLGLYIAHQIITAHGGSIQLDSAPGRGTTFTIFIPLQMESRKKLDTAI